MYLLLSGFATVSDWLSQLITSHQVLAPLGLLYLAETGIPTIIPNDLLLAYTGHGARAGQGVSLGAVFVAAQLVVLAGASTLFWLGKRWGQIIVDKVGKFLFIRPRHIERAGRLLQKHGVWAIIIGRHIAGVRVPITIFAAAAGMRYRTFLFATVVTTAPWIWFYLVLGETYGDDIQRTISKYTGLSIAVAVAVAVLLLALHFRGPSHRDSK
jgi:membrane protein DedA with SNARE-associated domain